MIYWIKILRSSDSIISLFVLSIMITLFGLLSPIFIIQILNRYITFGLEGTLLFLMIGAILVALLEFVFRNIRIFICSKIIEEPLKYIKLSILKNYFDYEYFNLASQKSKSFIEVADINNNLYQALNPQNQSNILDSFFALIIIFLLFILNLKLGLIFLVLILIFLAFQQKFSLNKKKINIDIDWKAHLNTVNELKERKIFLKLINANKFIGFKWSNFLDVQNIENYNLSKIKNLQANFNYFFFIISSIIIIGFGSSFVVNGELTIGTLIGFNIFSARAMQILSNAHRSILSLASVNKYFQLRDDFFAGSEKKTNGMKLNSINGDIELRGVTIEEFFSNHSIKNFSCKIEKTKITSLTGSNGAGKSLVGKLILGLNKPASGEVLCDGVNIQKFSMSWWRDQINYIPQKTFNLNCSVVDNIHLGNSKLNESEIVRVLNTVGLESFLKDTDFTFDKKISPDISFGIHKKIHIARALVKNSQIYIFDDPTESLDEKGQNFILNLIQSLKRSNKTIFCITNDRNILNVSDQVINLK